MGNLYFLGSDSGFFGSRTAIIPAPYDGTASYRRGAARAPAAILRASHELEDFDCELREEVQAKAKIHTLAPKRLPRRPQDAVEYVRKAVSECLPRFSVVIGGEHTVALGAAMAHAKSSLTVVQVDAHADLRDTFDGSRHSHACVMRRIHELGVRIVQVGIRSCSREEHRYAADNNLRVFWAPFAREMIPDILGACTDDVYLTIDADGFDPSVMPSVGTPVPGGLGWYEALELFRALFREKNIVGMDFVEMLGDGSHCADTAAALVSRLIGYRFCLRGENEGV